jgi:hypothetical protein
MVKRLSRLGGCAFLPGAPDTGCSPSVLGCLLGAVFLFFGFSLTGLRRRKWLQRLRSWHQRILGRRNAAAGHLCERGRLQ